LDVLTGRNPRYRREMLPKHFARLKAQQADRAIARYRWTSALALMDLELNTNSKPEMDAVAMANDILAERYLPIPPPAASATRFRNLVEYGAAVYSHPWCEAIAADLLTEFQKAPGGLLDPDVG